MTTFRAHYEFRHPDFDQVLMTTLPVVGSDASGEGDRGRMLVLQETGEVVPFGVVLEEANTHMRLQPMFVETLDPPIPATPGWVADIAVEGIEGQPGRTIGAFPVLAWVTSYAASDSPPGGHSIVLVPEDSEHAEAGPVRTTDLPGVARYRRTDDP